jgi:hypothetical protein
MSRRWKIGGARRLTGGSKIVNKLTPSDGRNAYSIEQLERMHRKFCRAMERAIRAGRERDCRKPGA